MKKTRWTRWNITKQLSFRRKRNEKPRKRPLGECTYCLKRTGLRLLICLIKLREVCSGVDMATDCFPPSSCCRDNSFAHISELLIGQIKQKSSKKCVVLRMLHIFFAVLPFSITLLLAYKYKIGKLDHMFLLRDEVLSNIK